MKIVYWQSMHELPFGTKYVIIAKNRVVFYSQKFTLLYHLDARTMQYTMHSGKNWLHLMNDAGILVVHWQFLIG